MIFMLYTGNYSRSIFIDEPYLLEGVPISLGQTPRLSFLVTVSESWEREVFIYFPVTYFGYLSSYNLLTIVSLSIPG